jgi:hypothetical protein
MYLVHGNTRHDTGASFLEDCIKNNLSIIILPEDNMYYFHYKGGSYLNQKKVLEWLMKNQQYWK